MASIKGVTKNLSKRKKASLLFLIGFFAIILSLGISAVYAYYHSSLVSGIIANKVGDFDTGDGDINMMIFKIVNGSPVRVYSVPESYYVFNDSLTSCMDGSSKAVTCNDGTGNCEYSYNSSSKTFTLTSTHKITCKFYFEEEADSDINVYVYLEDENGTVSYSDKTYTLGENIPAYGYVYSENYHCDSDATLTYDSETRKFTVATASKNNCYVYFNKSGNADIITNVYVQQTYGSDVYNMVESIPTSKLYTLNESKSSCYDASNNSTTGTITYVDGYINITATEMQTCDVYLDLQS